MTKILVVGDVHAADSHPDKRTDTYREDILNKLREITEIARDEAVTEVLFVGDIFHEKEPRKVSHRLIIDLSEIFNSFPTGIPVYCVVGNHDITTGRLQSLEKQPLQVLAHSAGLKLLLWNKVSFGNVTLHPIPGVPGITVEDYHITRNDDTHYNIIVSHQSVVPDISKERSILQSKSFIHDSQKIADTTEADMIFYGHQHRQDKIYTRKSKTGTKVFTNLGAICRLTIGQEDMNRKPSVFTVDFSDDSPKFKVIPLKNVRPIEEAYNLEVHKEKKAHKQDIEDAISRLKHTNLEKFSIESVMKDIEIRDDIDEPVRETVLDLLECVK